jgi:TolB protein
MQSESAAATPPPSEPESHIAFLAVNDNAINELLLAQVNDPGAEPAPPLLLASTQEGVWDFITDPTRSWIVYSALRSDGGADLWRVARDEEAALFLACPEAACSTPSFSSDGALLAYSKRSVTGPNVPMINPPRLWLLDVATGESAALFSDSQRLGFEPAFSSDSKWLAFVSPQPSGVGILNLESGVELFLPDGTGEVGAWRPDAPEIVMAQVITTSADYPTHLVRYNAETGARVDLSGVDALVQDDSPAFSPDGEWIAFRRKTLDGEQSTPGKQIWIMRADGSEARALTSSAEHDHAPPQWSLDGNRLTFHRYNLRNAPIVIAAMVYDVESGAYWEAATPAQEPMWLR